MKVTITGGAGFLGVRLARELLRKSTLSLAGASPQAISGLIVVDRAAPPEDLLADPRVSAVVGDLNAVLGNPAERAKVLPADVAVVFHLAAAVSGECEADFDLGMHSNLAATQALLEACRALKTSPTVVFASSAAVFGHSDILPLPAVLNDTTLPTPLTSYGIQKYIGEQLTADYGRKGFIRGRSVRLMTVSVRPGKPNGAASSFFSGMIREPLAGLTGACPVPPDTQVVLSSPATTIAGIVRAAEATDAEWGPRIALNLPSLSTTTGEMAAALARVAGKEVAERIDWTPNPTIQKIVATWPGKIDAARARGLGLLPDTDFDAVIRDYILENPHAVTGTRPA